jgi:predicted metalloprotease with PDZ domain
MANRIFILLAVTLVMGCGATKSLVTVENTAVVVHLDLVNVVDDKVKVTLDPGAFRKEAVIFRIPMTVPGTYSADDYGQYIDSLVAYDYNGSPLPMERIDVNTWSVANGSSLDRISYWANDTYDSESEHEEPVFSPAGSNILAGQNFMLNLHVFVGYFDGYKEVPYELRISKPNGLVATTSLQQVASKENTMEDIFVAPRYFEVIDNPIMYAPNNNISFQVNDITVNLAVYSPNGAYAAIDLKERMEKMMSAQKAFLGDVDSTKEYNILLYLSEMTDTDARGFGALEHHTSTVVVLPESLPKERMEQAMVDVVSHEFFHIVTPLNVHSKEIHDFDFNDPKMSQHLWMYEGTTEYFANLFQIQQGLISKAEFYERLMAKVSNAKSYDDNMSFTEMSKNILEEPYEENYANVYEKGTLINMALDILLREKSDGQKGVLWLMKELSKKYGKNTPFVDEDLIPEIVAMTYPEVGTFFKDHVVGNQPIAYTKFWAKVGLAPIKEEKQTGYFLDGEVPFIDVDQDNGDAIFIREGIGLNSFFTGLGAQGGDVIRKLNGKTIDLEAIRAVIGQSFGWSPDRVVTMEVERNGETVLLEGPVGTPMLEVTKLVEVEGISGALAKLREAWLKG